MDLGVIKFADQFVELTAAQLASLVQENGLVVVSEYVLFELVLKWIKYDRCMREQFTAKLIEKVRLPLLSGEELVEKVDLMFVCLIVQIAAVSASWL